MSLATPPSSKRLPLPRWGVLCLLVSGCDRADSTDAPPRATAPSTVQEQAPAKAEPKRAAAPELGRAAPEAAPPKPAQPVRPHPLTIDDLLAFDQMSTPQASPDDASIVFVRRTNDLESNRARTDVWRVSVDGGALEQLTDHPDADNHPRWSADGKSIYFLSSRSGSAQVWRMAADGSGAKQVTDLALPVQAFAVAPDDAHLVVAMDVFPDCTDLECTKRRLAEAENANATGRMHERLFARHWDQWKDGRRSHLFAVPTAGGPAVDLTPGLDADAPSKPFGDATEFTFTPTSDGVVFAARDVGKQEAWSTNFDLFYVPLRAPTERRNLTQNNPAWDTHPKFSPDGKTLVWTAMERPGYESDKFRLVTQPWSDGALQGEPQPVTTAWDRSVADFAFIDDDRVLVTAQDLGQRSLFELSLASGEVETRLQAGTISAPMPLGNAVAFLRNDLTHPADLWLLEEGSSEPKQLTSINETRLASVQMGEPEQFTFRGARGDTVYGYIVRPPEFDAEKTYPVAFLIHGGPQGSFGNMFHYRWNPQIYAGAGYVAVMIDFHGSTGYGQKFTDSIAKDWGGKPLEDLKRGLAHVQKTYPWVDGDRVCALGASYGGFMINWIAGNWPDRFRCLVNHDGVFDNRSMYYETEELWFVEWEHGGPHYENARAYERFNPVNFVNKWKTPMLVIHGELDYRVPVTQGLAAFTALQRRGIPSKLLVFPDENHWVLKPANSRQWHEEVLAWLGEHLQDTAPKATEADADADAGADAEADADAGSKESPAQ